MQDESINQKLSRTQPVYLLADVQDENPATLIPHSQLAPHSDFTYGQPLTGQLLAERYRLDYVIGSGGMSMVYRGMDLRLDETVAIKVLHSHLNFQQKSLQRFQSEGKALSRLDHPNIVKIYEYGLHADASPYMVMEFVDGPNLAARLQSGQNMPMDSVLEMAMQICVALQHAHSMSVIHRDLKPTNIMFATNPGDGSEIVKLVDFGIAKVASETHAQLTSTGEVFGSPIYMSPEQCGGLFVDHRTDLYSLGCIMYEALTGTPPMVGESALSTMLRHQQEIPLSLKQATLGEVFPDELERMVAKLLAKDPDDRYQSARELYTDLRNVKANGYAAIEIPTAPKTSVAADLFKAIQMDAASRAGLAPGIENDERFRAKPLFDKSFIVGSLIVLLVLLVGIMAVQLIPYLRGPAVPGAVETTAGLDKSVSESVNERMYQITAEQNVEELRDSGGWDLLILKQPRALNLRKHGELRAFRRISELKKLESFDAAAGFFRAGDIFQLKDMNLRDLSLAGLDVKDELQNLGASRSLVALNLSRTDVTDANLVHLPAGLRDLFLDRCQITDAGVKNLVHLKQLRNLSLCSTEVSDRSLAVLTKMHLKTLNVEGTDITSEALAEFHKKQPNCVIIGR